MGVPRASEGLGVHDVDTATAGGREGGVIGGKALPAPPPRERALIIKTLRWICGQIGRWLKYLREIFMAKFGHRVKNER